VDTAVQTPRKKTSLHIAAGIVAVAIVGASLILLEPFAHNRSAGAWAPNAATIDQQRWLELTTQKGRTDLMLERVGRLNGGQGFKAQIERAARLGDEAAALMKDHNLVGAGQKLAALQGQCEQIEALSEVRDRVIAKRETAKAAKDRAVAAGAVADAGAPLARADELATLATDDFEQGKFASAAEAWTSATARYEAAELLGKSRARQALETQVNDACAQASELLVKAKLDNNRAAASRALELLDGALALRAGDKRCTRLKGEVLAFLDRRPGDRMENSVGMVFSYIPAGTFMMGSAAGEKGRDDDENQVRVTLAKPFYLGRTVVTQGQWRQVMGENYHSPDGGEAIDFAGPDMPVNNVSWNDAVNFCRALSAKEHRTYRLPTEAEWEYACRAGTTTVFCTGDDLTNLQAQIDASEPYRGGKAGPTPKRPLRVASFPPNAWGLYDMHGNMAQWCTDWYAPYAVGEAMDPQGPPQPASLELANRIVRGGSWCHPARTARCASRWNYSPVVKTNYIGFRVVADVDEARDKSGKSQELR
jgi:formylglycine-generating enzyme required for sulfatase activity